MAKKKKDEDPEEEKNDQFDDDEDFGLPDLEYDELDEEDIEEDSDFEDSADEDEPDLEDFTDEEDQPGDDLEEPAEDEMFEDDMGVSDEMEVSDELEETGVADLGSEDEDWEKELENELESELEGGDMSGDEDLFYEEETYDEFSDDMAPIDSLEENDTESSVFSSDEAEEESVSSLEPEAEDDLPVTTTRQTGGFGDSAGYQQNYGSSYNSTGDSGSKGKFARVVVIGTLLFAVIAIVFWLVKPGGNDTPKKKVAEKVAPKKETPPPVDTAEQKKTPVVEKPVAVEKPVKPEPKNYTPGEVTVLQQRTGKSYVVIASFFDGDLAEDYSKELAAKGKSPMVIPPFKDYRYYRVAIAEFGSFKEAEANVQNYRGEFGQDVWPLRY